MHSGSSFVLFRDWSLITGRGGGACEVLPLRKGGGGGRDRKSLGVVLHGRLKF